MNINKLFILAVLLAQTISAQITFVVNEVPADHDFTKPIYISGDFEGWSGGNESYKLTQSDKGYSISIPLKDSSIAYKFTQGSWDLVEYNEDGSQRENRFYNIIKEVDTVYAKIASWTSSDVQENKSTASKNVSVISESFLIPQLNRERRIWIYLPPDYKVSNESYPVLYMHDGQNIFDDRTSYSGEWQVDETLDKLYTEKNLKMIVVGIDNGGEKRLNEYSPYDHPKYGIGEGDAYLEFIVKTLKPYIDSEFRTLKDIDNTGIMGSSMGGLISQYAGLKYPDVFGKVGVFSPAFWYAPKINKFAKQSELNKNQKVFFLAGGKEGGNVQFEEINQTVKDMNTMVDIMKAKGFASENMVSKVVPNGEHNEALWRSEFEEALMFLFKSSIKPNRVFKSVQFQDGDFLNVEVSDGNYHIRFYNSEIVETTFIPKGENANKKSHAVVMQPSATEIKFEEKENSINFSSEDLEIRIDKSPFKISYWYQGKEVISEKNGYRKTNDFETIQFNLTDDEILYGGGARALGMNRRGNRLELYNKADYGYEERSELMNYSIPIVMSSNKYMIHFDNAPIGFLDLDSKKNNTLTYETIPTAIGTGRKTYQVIVGDSWYDLIDNYTDLTGKQPMPPRWALGNFASRFGYHSQKETEVTIDKFKQDSIPVDAVILDIYWFGKDIKGHMGNMDWLRDSFPNPEKMIKDFEQKGVKTVLITEPFVLSTSNRWEEAVKEDVLAKDSLGNPGKFDFYFGNSGIIDIYNPKAEKWFWNIYKGLAEQGVKGVWGDLGEPEAHPSELIHFTGTADEVHNTYGHDWARLVYEGYERDFPNERPFILMRAGYSGSQRFGLIPWSGDVNRTWGGLKPQVEIALQMGMQGLGYMHSDLGGFGGDNLDDELYTRWLQYGVFQPIFRPHAQEVVPSEPVYREENTKQLAKESIELRYRMLPYNYNLVFENNQKGTPFMRPMFFDDESPEMLTNSSTYLYGYDFLVTPIIDKGAKEVEVHFPKNNIWFDFYSEHKVQGGQSKSVQTKENSIPTYVRAGAFIPIAELVQTTDDYTLKNFDLHYYHDESINESEREFYNDDGLTNKAFEKGQYEILEFEFEKEKRYFEVEFEAEIGKNYQSEEKQINLILHNIERTPKHVKLERKKLEYNYDSQNNTLSIPVVWNTSEEIVLKITLKK